MKATKLLFHYTLDFAIPWKRENAVNTGGRRGLSLWRGGRVNVDHGGWGYFIGLSVAFPLKRFRLPIPDFWRSQHYRKLSWSTCTPDRKQITAENAFSSRPRQRWPIKLATRRAAAAAATKRATTSEKGKWKKEEQELRGLVQGCKNDDHRGKRARTNIIPTKVS